LQLPGLSGVPTRREHSPRSGYFFRRLLRGHSAPVGVLAHAKGMQSAGRRELTSPHLGQAASRAVDALLSDGTYGRAWRVGRAVAHSQRPQRTRCGWIFADFGRTAVAASQAFGSYRFQRLKRLLGWRSSGWISGRPISGVEHLVVLSRGAAGTGRAPQKRGTHGLIRVVGEGSW